MNPFQNNVPFPFPPIPPPFFPPPSNTTAVPPMPTIKKVTLFVKNLPKISKEEIVNYFLWLGAFDIRLMNSKKMKNSGFIDFPDLIIAQNAIHHLENNVWNGNKVKASISKSHSIDSSNNNTKPEPTMLPQIDNSKSKWKSDDLTKFEPISTRLGINYPSNPDLKYKYPDPTPQTLANIMNAIGSVPKLYTQVLHLMNKMNLPPPFEGSFPAPPTIQTNIKLNNDILNEELPDQIGKESSSEESEIEVEDDEDVATKVPIPERMKSWAPERNTRFKKS